MKTYKELNEYLFNGKNKNDRPLENNTRVIKINDNEIGIKLHDTFVLIFKDDNTIIINTDGWQTITTKDRINKYSPNTFYLYTKDRIWYINHHSQNKEYLYQDYIKYYLDKDIFTDVNDVELKPFSPKTLKAKNKLKKQINDYCNKFAELFIDGKINKPSYGDCWFCLLIHSNDTDHLLSHIKEKYYVPSLLKNALDKHHEGMLAPIDKHNIACLWFNNNNEHEPIYLDMTKNRIKKVLKKYMFNQFGFAS